MDLSSFIVIEYRTKKVVRVRAFYPYCVLATPTFVRLAEDSGRQIKTLLADAVIFYTCFVASPNGKG